MDITTRNIESKEYIILEYLSNKNTIIISLKTPFHDKALKWSYTAVINSNC